MRNLLCIILLSTVLISNAQTNNGGEGNKQTPNKIRVYTPSSSSNSNSSNSKDNSYKWVAKTDMLSIITGEFPVVFEYRIAPKFSVEGSAGVTYAFLPRELFNDRNFSYDTKPSTGSAFRAAIKYYPSSDYDAIEGWSFGVQVFSKTMNREYNSVYSPESLGQKESNVKTGISLIIGKQLFAESNIAFEYFFGIGFANSKEEFFTSSYSYETSSNVIERTEISETSPNFQLGLRIGFGN